MGEEREAAPGSFSQRLVVDQMERKFAETEAERDHQRDEKYAALEGWHTAEIALAAECAKSKHAIELLRAWLADYENEMWPFPAEETRTFLAALAKEA